MEHLAMAPAARCGLPMARTALLAYDAPGRQTDDPSRTAIAGILVERFDRQTGPDGRVDRIYQEDVTQVLRLFDTEKYAHASTVATERRYSAKRLGQDLLGHLRDPIRPRQDILHLVLFSLAVGN